MRSNPVVARIAIVDDDRATLAILTDILRSGGFEVLPFRNGEEALAALWDAPVDLLVVDLLLPRMSGIDLVREVRVRPWARRTPALAITALRWSAEQVIAIETAMAPAELVCKPIHAGRLLSTVRAMLGSADQPPAFLGPAGDPASALAAGRQLRMG